MSSNVKIVKNNTKRVLGAMSGNNLAKAVRAGALILEGAVKISMSSTAHTGKVYGKHRASAPGETPAVDTSALVNSISTWNISSTETEAWAGCGTGLEYAEWLEFGTSWIEARPFMRPALDNNEEKIKAVVRKFAKDGIEGALG